MSLGGGLANLAVSTVATAPDPATSGTSLVVAAGHGARFPAPATDGPFWATVCAAGEVPDPSNAEIVQVTGRSTDTLTIVRAQGGTSARTVTVGDLVFLGVTKEMLVYRDALAGVALWCSGVR